MGTNYYVRDQIGEAGRHVGKTSSLGQRGYRWSWAMEPALMEKYIQHGAEFIDEYGRSVSPFDMRETTHGAAEVSTDSIGVDFC